MFKINFIILFTVLVVLASCNLTLHPSKKVSEDSLSSQVLITSPDDLTLLLPKRPTIIHFFSSWCHVCKKEMAGVNKFAQASEKNGVNFVAVALNDKLNTLSTIKDLKLPDTIVIFDNKSKFENKYKIDSVPTTIAIKEDGTRILLPTFSSLNQKYQINGALTWGTNEYREKILKAVLKPAE